MFSVEVGAVTAAAAVVVIVGVCATAISSSLAVAASNRFNRVDRDPTPLAGIPVTPDIGAA